MSMQLTELALPNKYDIIPIHNSDRAGFRRCRRYWDWNSPARQNLTMRAEILGISIPLWYGTGIHFSLEQHYQPGIKRSPVEAWKTWFDIQWKGGAVGKEWLPRVYDLNPQPIQPSDESWVMEGELYKVIGLRDILPDPNNEEFEELFELGVNMMTFYEHYADVNDGFEVVVAEHDFSIPIWDYENDCILMAVDLREESPNYGKKLEVHARGRQDGITLKPNGKLGIIDHKTAARFDEDLAVKLETDEQCTSYLYAAQIEAQYYDLPHKGEPFEEVLFNVLRKVAPKPPTILKNGYSFSCNRAEESTTYGLLMDYISKSPVYQTVGLSEKEQAYVDYLKEVGDENFIIRKPVRRNQHQLANAGKRMYLETMDMLYNPRIYPNLSNEFKCLNCQFRAPCLAAEDGSDYEQMLRDNYTSARDR